LVALLRTACESGLLQGADPSVMAEVFLGILMRGGLIIRMLMGVAEAPAAADIQQRAVIATASLWRLYGKARPAGTGTDEAVR